MATERELEEARAQAEEVGAALLLLLGLRGDGSRVRWDDRGFFVLDGRKVGIVSVRRLLDRIEKVGAERLRRLTADYFAGRLLLAEWRRRMERAVAGSHLLFGALALGSLEAAAGNPLVAARIAEQQRYALGFAKDLRAKKVSEPRGLARAASYLLAASATYHILEQVVQAVGSAAEAGSLLMQAVLAGGKEWEDFLDNLGLGGRRGPDWRKFFDGVIGRRNPRGKTEAKRIRRASESCPGCLIYAGRWIPIGMMPPIGSLDCGSHCRCYLIYR